MGRRGNAEYQHAQTSLGEVNRYIDILFNRAPIMMHSLDPSGAIVRVNRRWTRTLGYSKSEAVGLGRLEFLTEESRVWAITDTLPLFWRTGSARSVGYQFVKKNGRVMDVLLDAEAFPATAGKSFSYAAIRKGYDLAQWEQASTTITAIKALSQMRRDLEGLLRPIASDLDFPGVQQPSAIALEPALGKEALGALLELAQDTSGNLRSLLRGQEEWLGATVEHQRELLLVARNIDRTLADMADAISELAAPSKGAGTRRLVPGGG